MTPAEFESGVQRWHESDSMLDIWEFLGVSREEYAERVTGKRSDPPRTELYTYDHSGNVLSVDVRDVPNWTPAVIVTTSTAGHVNPQWQQGNSTAVAPRQGTLF